MEDKIKKVIGFAIAILLICNIGFLTRINSLNEDKESLILIIKDLNYENKILDGANDILADTVKQHFEIATSQNEILAGYEDISKIALERYKSSQDDLFKEREELYTCWAEYQRLDSILKFKYGWDGSLN